MKKISAAVIGVGSMGKNHARIYSELDGVELSAVCDIDEETARRVSDRYKCHYYTDCRKMLEEEDVDVASVAVPTNAHKEVALACIERGVNLLVEKPVSDTLSSARKIISAAKEKDVKLTVGHVERFNPAVVELKKRVSEGALGRVFKVSAKRVGPFPERIRDVGVVIDLATHDLDVMRYLTGSEVVRLYAETERRINTNHEDLLSAVLKFEDGTVGSLDVNWLTPEKIRELSVVGENGMFVVRYLTQELFFYENVNAKLKTYDYSDILMGISGGNVLSIRVRKTEPLKAEVASFVECVRKNKPPLVSGEDALKALELAHALIKSSSERTVITP
jgi:predicted dehydrogenase